MAEPDISYAGDNVAPFLVADAGPAYPVGPRGQPVITVRPKPKAPPPAADKPPSEGTGLKSIEDQPDYVDKSVPKAAPGGGSIEDQPDYVDKSVPMQPEREVGMGEAAAAAARAGFGFGFGPALQGVKAAAHAPGGGGLVDTIANAVGTGADYFPPSAIASKLSDLIGLPTTHEIIQGLARIVQEKATGADQPRLSDLITGQHKGSPALDAYRQGRDTGEETQGLAAKQHPGVYYPIMIGSSLAVPVPGLGEGAAAVNAVRAAHAVETARAAGASAATVERLAAQAAQAARGAKVAQVGQAAGTGAVMGGVQGIGEGVSQGQDLPGVLASGTKGAIAGFGVGGAIGAVLPRAAPLIPTTRGQRAAATARDVLQTPMARGIASDNRGVQALTSVARAVPILGPRISHNVEQIGEAAGHHIEGIAGGLTQGSRSRAVADTVVRPGLEKAIEANRQAADKLYNGVRGAIDQNAHFTMPRTKAALDEIVAARRAAGHVNPEAGLEQFRNVSNGATFNGAHRARVDARDAGNALVPHPGYNAADYNRLTKAMTADLKGMVAAGAKNQTQQGRQAAVDAFEKAEREFGPIAEANKNLSKIVRGQGESAIAKLIGAASEKGGDVRLLAELQRNMSPDAFQHLGGQLLFELGHMPSSPAGFSLSKFVTEWDKLSERGRDILFSPQHRADLERIFEMGQHMKGALKESSTSHSATPLVVFEMLKELGGFVGDVYAGGHGLYSAGAAATTVGMGAVTHWLGSPAQARAISNWATAYRAATLGAPTPARIAALKIASRNLAHNLNIPVEDVMRTMQKHTPAAAEEQPQDNRPQVPQSR